MITKTKNWQWPVRDTLDLANPLGREWQIFIPSHDQPLVLCKWKLMSPIYISFEPLLTFENGLAYCNVIIWILHVITLYACVSDEKLVLSEYCLVTYAAWFSFVVVANIMLYGTSFSLKWKPSIISKCILLSTIGYEHFEGEIWWRLIHSQKLRTQMSIGKLPRILHEAFEWTNPWLLLFLLWYFVIFCIIKCCLDKFHFTIILRKQKRDANCREHSDNRCDCLVCFCVCHITWTVTKRMLMQLGFANCYPVLYKVCYRIILVVLVPRRKASVETTFHHPLT